MEGLSKQRRNEYAAKIARMARWALEEEVKTTPKPGLVDMESNGAHSDMNAALFFASARELEPCFVRAVLMGMSPEADPEALFARLRQWGRKAEQRMYAVTGNVNTHKGCIFTIGLFCAAIGCCAHSGSGSPEEIRAMERRMVSEKLRQELDEISQRKAITHGEDNFLRYGTRGIRGMAIDGYREVFEKALPVLRDGKRQGRCWNQIKLQILVTLMSCIEDSNIIARRNPAVLKAVQQDMKEFLMQGGAYQAGAIRKLREMDERFSREDISGGGSADLLALTLFLDRVTERMEEKD